MFKKIFDFFFSRKKDINPDKLILIVDDGEVERKFMQKTLTQRGYRVVVGQSGEEAVKLARENKPDLIFLDYSMPGGINGQQACKLIKSETYANDIPIVFLSGSATPSKVIDCYDARAEYYLAKPINAATLLNHTRLLLEDAQLSKQQSIQQNERYS